MNAKKSVWLAVLGGLAAVFLSAPAQAGACCFDDGSCQDLAAVECAVSGGSYQGDLADCASIECAGACYFLPDSMCLDDMWPDLCNALGGVYVGFGTDCQTLLAMATGACCYYDGACNLICEEVSDTICDAVGGIFQGAGTLCDDITCVDFGACCFPDQSCQDRLTEAECVAAGGDYQGDCTDCEGVVCPFYLRGACCFTDGTCDDELTETECEDDLGGLYQGFLTECASTVCVGACCFEIGGDCQPDYTAADCVADGGYFQGYGTLCNPPTNECPAETQCQTYSFDQGNLTEVTLQFDEFDDQGGLRLLEKVKVRIDASVHAFLLLTNISQQPADPCVNVTEQVFLKEFPTITPPPQLLIDEFTEECCPPPGYQLPPGETCDFGGVMSWPDTWPVEVYYEITDPTDLLVFIGNGQFDAVVQGFGEIQWVGSLFTLTNLLHRVEGAICVTYEYGLAGACCFCDGTCEVLTQEECDDLSDPSNDPWSYDWHEGLSCDQVTCDPVGACCLCDGQCDDGLTEQECDDWAASEGLWVQSWSECLTCAEVTCEPVGACCLCDETCLDNVTEADCLAQGGQYQGDCSDCSNIICEGWGACCLCDETCLDDVTEAECLAQGGQYQGDCTDCSNIICEGWGACCLCDETCLDDVTEAECLAQGGQYQGDCSDCSNITCEGWGACCLCDQTCLDDVTEAECLAQGGEYQGDCTTCADVICDGWGACCLCDGQCDDNLSEQECEDWAAGQGLWVQQWYECLTCADITCEPVGACCFCDATCQDDMTEQDCINAGGEYQGDCTTCADVICDGWGACCLCDGQCADDLSEQECEDWAAGQGLWVQQWYECLTCADITCEPVGACCFCDKSCQDNMTQQDCVNAGGEYQGDCTTCADVICEGWGACCFCDGNCIPDISKAECESYEDSFYLGDCTDCGDCPPFGACCFCDETCEDCVTEIQCENMGGRFQGAGTLCEDVVCVGWGACCFPDDSCIEDLTEQECLNQGGDYAGDCSGCEECAGVGGCIEKGSLVFFSKVEIRWNYMGYLVQDTFLSLTNDYPDDVWVQMYFINGDPPLEGEENERPHPGWNWVDNKIHLTANQPIYWSALTGLPANVSPFTVLDPGDPPGRPAMDGTDHRVLRGYVVAWAVTQDGSDEIKWNHLAGNGTLVNYGGGSGWEYKACAFQVVDDTIFHGQPTGTPGELFLDGSEYGKCSDLLLMNFQAVGSSAFSAEGAVQVISNTDLTLHPVSADLRQNNDGPVATKADIDIWNQWEAHFSGHRCIACWDQTLLEFYGIPNHFLLQNLQTDHGKARINGVANELCNLDLDNDGVDDVISQPAALLGLVAKLLTIDGGADYSSAGTSLFGLGGQNAKIKYDAQDGGPPPAPPLPPKPTKEDLQDFVDQILQQIKKGGSD